jgi:hypothetical protein
MGFGSPFSLRFPSSHKYGSLDPVKTTLEIPNAILRKVKATAAQQGRTMKEYITEALTEKLAAKGEEQGWRGVLGKLSPEARKAAREVDAVIRAADFNIARSGSIPPCVLR